MLRNSLWAGTVYIAHRGTLYAPASKIAVPRTLKSNTLSCTSYEILLVDAAKSTTVP